MKEIYCCGCGTNVQCRLTDGREIYPHRPDLHNLPFWKHDECGNYVGCHHKTNNRTRPLGSIPTPEISQWKRKIHRTIDPLWKGRHIKRKDLYQKISDELGYSFHAGEIRSVDEAKKILNIANKITNPE